MRGATQITKVGENTVASEPLFPEKKIGKIQKKPSLQRLFLSTAQKQKVAQPILS